MSLERELNKRAENACELCKNDEHLSVYTLAPAKEPNLNKSIQACNTCISQIEDPEITDANHWRCLNDSMWSEHQAVQVTAWRMLSRLRNEGWPKRFIRYDVSGR